MGKSRDTILILFGCLCRDSTYFPISRGGCLCKLSTCENYGVRVYSESCFVSNDKRLNAMVFLDTDQRRLKDTCNNDIKMTIDICNLCGYNRP